MTSDNLKPTIIPASLSACAIIQRMWPFYVYDLGRELTGSHRNSGRQCKRQIDADTGTMIVISHDTDFLTEFDVRDGYRVEEHERLTLQNTPH
jgi:hypothetical protein